MTLAEDGAPFLPHPFEGAWREREHEPGFRRQIEQRLLATEEAAWHVIKAEVRYRLIEGGPVVVSVSPDGIEAHAYKLLRDGDGIAVLAGKARTISCLGAEATLSLTFSPDIPISQRDLLPDDWYPGP